MTPSSRSALFLALALVGTTVAGAQQSPTRATTVSVVGGVSQWDLSGSGTSPVLGARIDRELNSVFLGEAGFTVMRSTEQFEPTTTYVFPEVQLQAQLPLGVVRPYLGAGLGFGTGSASGAYAGTTRTIAGTGGVRILIPKASTTIRAELRVRGVGDEFTGAMAEWTLGFGHRF